MINKKQYQNLERARRQGNLSHAYLLVGPEKTGKFNTVMKFVSNFSKVNVKKIEDHPDFFLVKPEIGKKKRSPILPKKQGSLSQGRRRDISVRQVKEKVKKLFLHPFELPFQILVIEEAEKLTTAAANSLLKLIEEPPKNVFIFILSHQELSLLPTIRSRCQMVRFSLTGEEMIVTELDKELNKELNKELRERVGESAKLSCGRIELAREYLADEKKRDKERGFQEKFKKALKGGVLSGLELVEEIGGDREELLLAMDRWLWWLRDFLKEMIEKKEDSRVIEKVNKILKQLIWTRKNIKQTNADHKLQLENFFVQLM